MPKVIQLKGASSEGQGHGRISEGSLQTYLLHLTQPTCSLANGKAGRMPPASISNWGTTCSTPGMVLGALPRFIHLALVAAQRGAVPI